MLHGKIIIVILVSNVLNGICNLYQLLYHLSSSKETQFSTRAWAVLPVTVSAQSCPCNHCGETTRCYNMNHVIVPVGLPANGVERLYLHSNMITKVYGNDFRDFTSLQMLTLYGNNITEIDKNAFTSLVELKRLHLEHNRIRYITKGTLARLKNLRNLFLNDNELLQYPGDLPYLASVEKLNLDNNMLERIHWTSFVNMGKLTTLNLWNNPLTCDCNTKKLIKWLTATSRGKVISGSIGPPPEACVSDNSGNTKCAAVSIKKVEHVNSASNVYILGKNATLHCQVARDLMPYWLTPGGGRVLPYTVGRLEAHINGTLKISNIIETDNGTYKCFAQYVSSSARSSKEIELVVIAATKPRIKVPKHDIELSVGTTAQLKCDVTGAPEPKVTWFAPGQSAPLDESNFTSNSKLKLSDNGMQLTVKELSQTEHGLWRCRATNSEGSTVGQRRLMVMVANSNMTIIIVAVAVVILVIIVAIVTIVVCRIRKSKRQVNVKEGDPTMMVQEEQVEDTEIENVAQENEEKKHNEREKHKKHTTFGSISSRISEKNTKTESKEDSHKKEVKNDEMTSLETNENPCFVLNYIPGSNEIQQPYEYEPEVKGFRL